MVGRFLGLAVAITAVSVGVASIASRSAGDDVGAPATAKTQDNGNWTTRRGKRGGWSSGSSEPGATASGREVRLGRSGDSHFYDATEVDGTTIRPAERRVGKEAVRTGNSRWAPTNKK